jgi:NADH dehydrogenase/NADH:ubiquinone oxidoreductase subunit G
MMGVCFDCLVEIDGVPNQQACLTAVREGMVIRWQDGKAALEQLHETV